MQGLARIKYFFYSHNDIVYCEQYFFPPTLTAVLSGSARNKTAWSRTFFVATKYLRETGGAHVLVFRFLFNNSALTNTAPSRTL